MTATQRFLLIIAMFPLAGTVIGYYAKRLRQASEENLVLLLEQMKNDIRAVTEAADLRLERLQDRITEVMRASDDRQEQSVRHSQRNAEAITGLAKQVADNNTRLTEVVAQQGQRMARIEGHLGVPGEGK